MNPMFNNGQRGIHMASCLGYIDESYIWNFWFIFFLLFIKEQTEPPSSTVTPSATIINSQTKPSEMMPSQRVSRLDISTASSVTGKTVTQLSWLFY